MVPRSQVEQDLLGLAHKDHHPPMTVRVLLQEPALIPGLRLRDVSGKQRPAPPVMADMVGKTSSPKHHVAGFVENTDPIGGWG